MTIEEELVVGPVSRSPPRARSQKLTLYYPAKEETTVTKAKEIFKREKASKRGVSMSKFVMEKLAEYVRLHEPGNPQQRLDVVLKLGKAYHAPGPLCRARDCFRNVAKVLNWKKSKTETEQVGLCEKHAALCLREFPLSYSIILEALKKNEATKESREVG